MAALQHEKRRKLLSPLSVSECNVSTLSLLDNAEDCRRDTVFPAPVEQAGGVVAGASLCEPESNEGLAVMAGRSGLSHGP